MTAESIIDEHGRTEPPFDSDEVATLVGFLDYQRATLRWKCDGLDDVGFRAMTAASSMTLGGLVRHLSFVEDHWFNTTFAGNEPAPPWDTVDWDADQDWDWHSGADAGTDELLTAWADAVERSRALVTAALATGGLEQQAQRGWPTGDKPNLRWILVHMIEEYARHNGHADLLREAADGGAIGE